MSGEEEPIGAEGAAPRGKDLAGADLSRENLSEADLRGANLTGARLEGADLTEAHLEGADLRGANLTWSNLRRAFLTGADLTGAKLPEFQLCPPKGTAFRAWKKVWGGVILELKIPADAERTSSLIGRKCRASRALVVSATWANGNPTNMHMFSSSRHVEFKYQVGEVAEPDGYDGDIRVECTRGIHFFMTREEAVNY